MHRFAVEIEVSARMIYEKLLTLRAILLFYCSRKIYRISNLLYFSIMSDFFLSTLKCKHWFSVFSIHSVICKSCGMCLNAIENIMPERSMVSASVFYQHNTVHVKSDSLIGAHNWKSVGIATAQFLKISCRLW